MPYPIEDKLVVGVTSSALFRLDEADAVFRRDGLDAYREYQRAHENNVLAPGVAFPFIRRFLQLNTQFPDTQPVDVVLLSRNDADTGLRVFNSIKHYGLGITRAAFASGDSPFRYVPAYNIALFLTANPDDAREATALGHPAGLVLDGAPEDDPADNELRVAFDFDGVIADDAAEQAYQRGGLAEFFRVENARADRPHAPGPLSNLFRHLGRLRRLEEERRAADPARPQFLKTAIVTARDAPAHRPVVMTLRAWGIGVDQAFFLGGITKARVLAEWRPHLFFDDQTAHLDPARGFVPSVHVPFGAINACPNP